MISTFLVLLSLLVLIGIFFLKLWNVVNLGQVYDNRIVFIALAASFLFYGLLFFGLSAGIVEATETGSFSGDDGTTTFEIGNQNYFGSAILFQISGLLVLSSMVFTVAELFLMFPNLFKSINKTL